MAAALKATILCGLLAVLVLRGAAGEEAGRRLLPEKQSAEVAAAEEGEQQLWDRSSAGYSLGPKITKWDEQRVIWNAQNPGRNVSRSGKPKTMLVSASQPGPCANPMGDFYHLKFLKNRVDYARLHGLELFYNMATIDKAMNSFWAKLPLLRKLMLSHPEVEWIWWMDSDAIFTDMAFEMPMDKYEGKNLVVHGFHNLLFEQHRWIGLNTGSFLIRNCQWSLDLLDAWAPFGPDGENRVNAGKLLTAKLVDRPVFEADDQSALAYLLLFDDPKWKAQTHLEWEFFLQGYWKYVVYNYENLMATSQPGFGDDRWPLVTHFVGCRPCQPAVTPEVEECFMQMERAFNFADNQVLDKYGYAHKALASFKTQRIRKDTSDPLGIKDGTMAKAAKENPSDLTFQEQDFLRNKERVEKEMQP